MHTVVSIRFFALYCRCLQVMSLIVAANRDCLEEMRVLEDAEKSARTFAVHTLTSLRMVRGPPPHTLGSLIFPFH
jgi:hypothetical protein